MKTKTSWVNHIEPALELYNNRPYTTIKMTPNEKSNEQPPTAEYHTQIMKNPRFQMGNYVRVPDKRDF